MQSDVEKRPAFDTVITELVMNTENQMFISHYSKIQRILVNLVASLLVAIQRRNSEI